MGDTVRIAAKVRMNFANQHLMTARESALRMFAIESEHAPGYDESKFGAFFEDIIHNATATVVIAVAALEAYLGEVRFSPERNFPKIPTKIAIAYLDLAEREPIMERVRLYALLNGKAPRNGKRPGQSIPVLVKLRNELVHYEPSWAPRAELTKEVLSFSKSPSPFIPVREAVDDRLWMSYSAAKWAVESVRDFVLELADDNGWHCEYRQHAARLSLPKVPATTTRRAKP